MKIQKLSSLKLGDSLKKLQFKFVKFIVQYPFVVIVICALISIALSICGLYMSPLTSLSLPTKELSTIGTPLSTRRNIKEKLDRLLQNKELYKIDDLVKKFNQTQSDLLLGLEKTGRSLTNYALVSSKDDNKGDYSDESEFSDDMIQRIAKEIGSSFVENQKFKRDIDSVEDVDENGNVDGADGDDGEEKEELNEKKIELVSDDDSNLFAKKSTFISCNSVLNDECAQMILESKDPITNSLLSFEAINIQCNFIEQYLKPYLNNGVLKTKALSNDIQVESLSSVITKFSGKDTCNELDRIDVGNFTLIFKYCSLIYKKLANYSLMEFPSLEQAEQLKLAPLCRNQNLIDSYNYLIDKNFFIQSEDDLELNEIFDKDPLDLEQVESPQVRYTSIYLSVNKKDQLFLTQFYNDFLSPHFLNKPLEINENVSKFTIIGLNFDIKQSLFDKSMTQSLKFLISSFCLFSFLLVLLSKSPSILLGFLFSVLFGFLDSYFFYKICLHIEFFSFINILSFFFLTIYTSTNIFLFIDTWKIAKAKNKFILYNYRQDTSKSDQTQEDLYENNPFYENYLENCVFYTYKNVLWPLLISLAVILAGILVLILTSSIVIVKIYAIFLAISIFFNFSLTIFLIPAILIIKNKSFFGYKLSLDGKRVKNLILNMRNLINKLNFLHDKIFELYLPIFIMFYRYILILISVILGVTSFVLVFYRPRLQVTHFSQFRIFSNQNPIEYYESNLSFLTDTTGIFTYQSEINKNLPINYIFGIEITDQNSLMYNLDELGDLRTGIFDFYDEKSQLWFDKFCRALNNSLISEKELKTYEKMSQIIENLVRMDQNENKNLCFYDLMRIVMRRKCVESEDMVDSYCCDLEFPFDADILESCLKNKNFLDLYVSPYENILAEKLYFNKATGLLDIVEYDQITSHEWTSNYDKMSEIFNEVSRFSDSLIKIKFVDLNNQEQEAKSLEKSGFFVSNFEFFDFQKSLRLSTFLTFLLSLLILTLIILITTRNFFITLIAVLTVAMSITSTVAILILFDLKINVTSLITIATSIFMSINSLVFLSISYSTLLSSNQETYQEFTTMFFVCENTIESLLKRFSSSVFKPCLLGIVSLSLVVPCEIYSFQMAAIFYMLSSFFNLFYTFFMFLPLCTMSPAISFCCDFRGDHDFQASFQVNKEANVINRVEVKQNKSNDVFTTSI